MIHNNKQAVEYFEEIGIAYLPLEGWELQRTMDVFQSMVAAVVREYGRRNPHFDFARDFPHYVKPSWDFEWRAPGSLFWYLIEDLVDQADEDALKLAAASSRITEAAFVFDQYPRQAYLVDVEPFFDDKGIQDYFLFPWPQLNWMWVSTHERPAQGPFLLKKIKSHIETNWI